MSQKGCMFERDEIIHVRVEFDEFYDDEPGPPKLTEGVQVKRDRRERRIQFA
jgi:hypothetical protein